MKKWIAYGIACGLLVANLSRFGSDCQSVPVHCEQLSWPKRPKKSAGPFTFMCVGFDNSDSTVSKLMGIWRNYVLPGLAEHQSALGPGPLSLASASRMTGKVFANPFQQQRTD